MKRRRSYGGAVLALLLSLCHRCGRFGLAVHTQRGRTCFLCLQKG
jgi:hypothetical protein